MIQMIESIKKYIVITIAALGLLVPVVAATTVSAQNIIEDGVKTGSCLKVTGDCDVSESPERINDLITTVINIFSIVVGVVAVIMIIIGGLKYITSSGDSNNVTSAKNTILYAIIGLVVVALAQFIVKFVLQKATAGSDV